MIARFVVWYLRRKLLGQFGDGTRNKARYVGEGFACCLHCGLIRLKDVL